MTRTSNALFSRASTIPCETISPPLRRPPGSTVVSTRTVTLADASSSGFRFPLYTRAAVAVEEFTLPPLYSAPPPRLTVLQALRRNALVAVIPVVVLVLGALAIGLARHPVYTSEARLNVGGLNLTQQSTEGYVTAVQALAQAYARVIDANGVVKPVAKKLHTSQLYVIEHSATVPIQQTPVIRVIGTGDSAKKARLMADAMANQIVKYAININAGKATSDALRKRFLASSRAVQDDTAKLNGLSPNDPKRQSIQTQIDGAKLEMQANTYLYQQSRLGESFTGVVPTKAGGLAIGIAALAVLIYLMRTIDPAWLLSAGIVGSMFAAHWDQLGVNTQPSPHRILLIAGVVTVLFRIGRARERPSLSLTSAHFALAAAAG